MIATETSLAALASDLGGDFRMSSIAKATVALKRKAVKSVLGMADTEDLVSYRNINMTGQQFAGLLADLNKWGYCSTSLAQADLDGFSAAHGVLVESNFEGTTSRCVLAARREGGIEFLVPQNHLPMLLLVTSLVIAPASRHNACPNGPVENVSVRVFRADGQIRDEYINLRTSTARISSPK